MTPVDFLRLPRVAQLPTFYKAALRHRRLDERYVNRVMKAEELFETSVDLSGPELVCRAARNWLQRTFQRWMLRYEAPSDSSLSFLVFRDVSMHDDGELSWPVFGTPSKPHCFLNVHLAGSGHLLLEDAEHFIEAGDAYRCDQRRQHGWRSSDGTRCRAVSFWLPHERIEEVMLRMKQERASDAPATQASF